MFLKCFLILPTFNPMFLIDKFLIKNVYLKLSLSMFLKGFLIFAIFQPHVSYRQVSYKKKTCIQMMPVSYFKTYTTQQGGKMF